MKDHPRIHPSAKAIEAFALDPENHEAFARILARVLPEYTRFEWGKPAPYKKHFRLLQKAGVTVYPNHFYSPVPDLSRLDPKRKRPRAGMVGIHLDAPAMLRLARSFSRKYGAEYAEFSQTTPNRDGRFYFGNGVYERIDAEVLHCMVRHHRPKRIIEIGSGFSSLITATACEQNRTEGSPCDFTLIEPYPNDLFQGEIPGLTRLLRYNVEECPLALFEDLEAGDILFIDSTHVIRSGNDVEYEYFEIIPRLKPGVLIHIHDIFLPYRYPESWLQQELVFWNEQYLVEAMLTHNRAYRVLWAGAYMHALHPAALAAAFPGYDPAKNLPGSLWLIRR